MPPIVLARDEPCLFYSLQLIHFSVEPVNSAPNPGPPQETHRVVRNSAEHTAPQPCAGSHIRAWTLPKPLPAPSMCVAPQQPPPCRPPRGASLGVARALSTQRWRGRPQPVRCHRSVRCNAIHSLTAHSSSSAVPRLPRFLGALPCCNQKWFSLGGNWALLASPYTKQAY
ncbi:unspecified product [Leishmania tarentolae]|uniref:Unspecified product n=1 Tax=Leishmania tarentolae TaxID=5689 RepID=A0A640KQB4_LEITA|nr:unspecified product [Leishmania tarentolae]